MLRKQKSRLFRGRSAQSTVKKTTHRMSVERLEERMLLAIRVWDDDAAFGSGDYDWTTPENWVGNAGPQDDDNLVFPDGLSGARLTSNNDFLENTRFRTITISGSGYNITGISSWKACWLITSPASLEAQYAYKRPSYF